MDPTYRFTMSEEDQKKFVSIEKSTKYGDLLKAIRENMESQNKQINFKEQSSSKFVLAQIDKKMMQATIEAFPLDLSLNDRNIYNFTSEQIMFQRPQDKFYDIRFVMPLLYHSVSPSLFVDCRDFIARRCLALTLTGLASEDFQMRALCYKILERFYDHLLSHLMIDKQLWINFLDIVRASIPSSNAKLRFLFTIYLTKIIDVLLHPYVDKMYELVKEFLAGRPRLRIDTIEIYDDLLLCSDVDYYNNNLRWLVTLFRDGTRSQLDLKTLENLNVISQVMLLYNSELRFLRANETILTLFKRITTVEGGAFLLINIYSFLPWLQQVILNHINQDPSEFRNDPKSESLDELTRDISSLVFNLADRILKKSKNEENASITRILELVNVFIVLHDLVIKSKNAAHLRYYINYLRKVTKAIRKDGRIPDEQAVHLLNMVKSKLNYVI